MRNSVEHVTSEQYWRYFYQFCYYEILSGGPDPHMKMVIEASKDIPYEERLWRAGLYIGFYNYPSAEAVWRQWSLGGVLTEWNDFVTWFHENWNGFRTRIERRSVRKPENMLRFIEEFADWTMNVHHEEAWFRNPDSMSLNEVYEQAWDSCMSVYSIGRYVAHKLLELGQRSLGWHTQMPDIRAEGGWSPRWTLGKLFQEEEAQLAGDDSPGNIALVNERASDLLGMFRDRLNGLDYFRLQVLLCEFRENIEGQRQYPGRSHDSELSYFNKITPYWKGQPTDFYAIRSRLFPWQHLGERNDKHVVWTGARDELGEVLSRYGYTWSDMEYDYGETVRRDGDFKRPVMQKTEAERLAEEWTA